MHILCSLGSLDEDLHAKQRQQDMQLLPMEMTSPMFCNSFAELVPPARHMSLISHSSPLMIGSFQ